MSTLTVSTLLLLVMIWPLLLAAAVAFGATRPVALRLVPWAALPALVAAVALADSGLRLPDTLLASALVLDSLGRVFLLLNAILWLAAGLLLRGRLRNDGAGRFAVLQLLAMTGSLGLALAGDALLFFTAATLAGYALYGLLVSDAYAGAQKAGRVLVVLLVVSDLLVFELLLLLGQAAGSVDFPSLRQALLNADNQGVLLVLLIAGFGIKAGIAGVHFWLAPVFLNAVTGVRPALIAFMFAAGLLGWLRLLPLGELHWSAAGSMLQWLAWVTLGYAAISRTVAGTFPTGTGLCGCCTVRFLGGDTGIGPAAPAGLAGDVRTGAGGRSAIRPFPVCLDAVSSTCARGHHCGVAVPASRTAVARRIVIGDHSHGYCRVTAAGRQCGGAADVLGDGGYWLACRARPVAERFRQPGCTRCRYACARNAANLAGVHGNDTAGDRGVDCGRLAGRGIQPRRAVTRRIPAPRCSCCRPPRLLAWLSTSRFMPYLPVLPPGDLLVPISSAAACRPRLWPTPCRCAFAALARCLAGRVAARLVRCKLVRDV